jgi:hypothetical protein
MKNDNYFQLLPEQAQARLRGLAEKVIGIVPIEIGTFHVSTGQLIPDVTPGALLDELAMRIQKDYKYLYYIRALNSPNLTMVERAFTTAKQRDKNQRAYARLIGPSEFLYVGSSSSTIQRCKDHLGYCSPTTYSLQLAHWTSNLNLELDFVYAKYDGNIDPDVIQVIEDTLWDNLKPMFGRKGQR